MVAPITFQSDTISSFNPRLSGGLGLFHCRTLLNLRASLIIVSSQHSETMLGKTTILASLVVAVYNGNPQVWNIFYFSLGIGFLRWLIYFIALRRKFSKLVYILIVCF